MKVETYLFGNVELDPEKIITFPQGLKGFEEMKKFMLVHEDNQSGPWPSFTLQSLDDKAVAVQIVDPTVFGFHYELALSEEETALLKNPAPEDVAVMQVVFKKEGAGKEIAANLLAPILINMKAKVGLQKIIETLKPNIVLSNLASAV